MFLSRPNEAVSTLSRPKAAGAPYPIRRDGIFVSTLSRPKAAGGVLEYLRRVKGFQHSATRRRLNPRRGRQRCRFRFNTQPPEGGCYRLAYCPARKLVSTLSRPKAAGRAFGLLRFFFAVSTLSRPKAAGGNQQGVLRHIWFQHSAARRRLIKAELPRPLRSGFNTQPPEGGCVSNRQGRTRRKGFNTQPPEGGWQIGNAPPQN